MRPRRLRRRWRILIALAIVYALVTFGGVADWIILTPLPGHFDAGHARRETVELAGSNVEVWVARSPALADDQEPQGYVLEFCGSGTRAEQIADYVAQRWKQHPVEAWVMNNPGVGGSDGFPRLKRIAPAALAVYDQIRRRAPHKPIFVEANSLGTNAALCVAAHRDVAGCVLHDPVPLRQLILGKYGWWNAWLIAAPVAWQVPDQLDAIENAKRVKCPAVFILARDDDYILPKYHKLITDAYAAPTRIVSFHGGHWSSVQGEAEKQVEENLNWLWESARQNSR